MNDDSGPVYPQDPDRLIGYGLSEEKKREMSGISLLDWFAGQALAGLCAASVEDFSDTTPPSFASLAYRYADAMIAERAKRAKE